MKNKGFSLIELMIVIAIMAVLVGIVAPQFFGYTSRAKETVAKDEIYNLVKVANINLMENELNGKYSFANSLNSTEATDEFVNETVDKSNANGSIGSMLVALSSVTYTKYTSLNGVTAIYDITKTPTIYIEEGEGEQVVSTKYYNSAKTILKGIDVDTYSDVNGIDDLTHDIQKAYANENGGELPKFTATDEWDAVKNLIEANGLSFHSSTKVNELSWIPSSTSDKQEIIMYAGVIVGGGISGNINNAGIAYYNGNYYYHVHGYYENQISGTYVGDVGKDTVTFQKLEALSVGTKIDNWLKFE